MGNPDFLYLERASTRPRHQTRTTSALGIGLEAGKIAEQILR